MNIKDFASVRKTLRTIQNLQSNAKVYSFGINRFRDKEDWFCVTVFKTKEGTPQLFYFSESMGAEGRRDKYEEIIVFICSK